MGFEVWALLILFVTAITDKYLLWWLGQKIKYLWNKLEFKR